MEGGEEGVVVCGCNRPVNVNDTDPRRRVRSAKPSQKPPSGPHTEPSPAAAPRYAPGPRLVLVLGRARKATRGPGGSAQVIAAQSPGTACQVIRPQHQGGVPW